MKCMRVTLGALITIAALSPLSAAAQLGFSRACHFTELGTVSQRDFYHITFQTIFGTPINDLTADVKTRLWALESITADYGSFRYFLLAYSGQYQDNALWRVFQSPWDSNSLYDNNRGLMTSVRAGSQFGLPTLDGPGIFELLSSTSTYNVVGVHYYLDPDVGQYSYIGISRASNCSCTTWGFQLDWANAAGNFYCSNF